MLKIAIKHYRVPLWEVRGRRKGPPSGFIPDAERRHKKIGISNHGGKTIATVIDVEDGHIVATGVSVCSMSDNFDYKVGVDKAILMAGYAVDQSLAMEWSDAKREFYRKLHEIPRAIKTVPAITEHNDLGVGVGPAIQFDVTPQVDNSALSLNTIITTMSAIERVINDLKINLIKYRLKK